MIWGGSSCGNECTRKFSALTQIPWRVFCKKGCDVECQDVDDCAAECHELCYKEPVLEDQKWSAYIDRSPGSASYSEKCFNACTVGCTYNFKRSSDKVDEDKPDKPPSANGSQPSDSSTTKEDNTKAST